MTRTATLTTTFAALALAATALTGCAATTMHADPSPSPSPTASAAPEPISAETTSAQDEVTCEAFADVQTIVHNAQAAFHTDRMGQKELSAWFSLASRVLGNIPSAEEGPVAEALASLQQTVPAVPDLQSSNIVSEDGSVAGKELYEACTATGFEVVINGFTGG